MKQSEGQPGLTCVQEPKCRTGGTSVAFNKASKRLPISPLLSNPEVERQVAGDGEDRDEDTQRSYIRPPKRLCPEPEHGQDRSGGYIQLNTELKYVR